MHVWDRCAKCGSSIIAIFEVTTYKELSASLSDIMQTWDLSEARSGAIK